MTLLSRLWQSKSRRNKAGRKCPSCDILRGFGTSEDLCLLRWRESITCRRWCFGKDVPIVFAKEFYVFIPSVISHYGRPSQLALIRFSVRRLDDSASVFVLHTLESWISHPKESEPHLTASLFRYPNRKTSIQWVRLLRRFAVNERDT